MYTSDINACRKSNARTAVIYLACTAFCGFFSSVYGKFSHGVSSDFMVFLCTVPFVLGVIPYTALWLFKLKSPSTLFSHVYNCGVATLTVGFCMAGVFEIYGSECAYVPIYFYLGTALTALGCILCLIELIKGVFEK